MNDFLPRRFRLNVHGVVEAGDELAGKERPVSFRQGQQFGHFFSINAHAAKTSAKRLVLTSFDELLPAALRHGRVQCNA